MCWNGARCTHRRTCCVDSRLFLESAMLYTTPTMCRSGRCAVGGSSKAVGARFGTECLCVTVESIHKRCGISNLSLVTKSLHRC